MKKIILAAFVAVASLTANAQVWVGGELGLGTSKTTDDGTQTIKSNYAIIIPEIGYKINDKFDVAVAIGLNHSDIQGAEKTRTYVSNSFKLNPYVRYSFCKAGNFTFFVDGGFAYENVYENDEPNKQNNWEIAIKPGFSYSLSDKVSLVAHVGNLAYTFSKQGDVKTNSFDLGVDGYGLTFGAYVNF